MSYGVDFKHGSDPVLLWLWYRPAAIALIQPLAWELLVWPKKQNKKTKTTLYRILSLEQKLKLKLKKEEQLKHYTATSVGWSQHITARDISQLSKLLVNHNAKWKAGHTFRFFLAI